MTTIQERRQALEFDPAWEVVKWDEASEFVGSMDTAFSDLTGAEPRSVKAADVVAARRGSGRVPLLLVAEFKDFDHADVPLGQRDLVAQRSTSGEVMRDVLAKIIDSICGAAFAHDAAGGLSANLAAFRAAVGQPTTRLLVLYCVEIPKPVDAMAWNTELKRRLRWLGPRATVVVTSSARPYTGNGITYSVSG